MSGDRSHPAARIVRNSIVLFLLAALAKGSGLLIAVIVARYLGAEALGVYAVLIALTMILEINATLGQQDIVIRAVAREPGSMLRLWVESTATATLVAIACSLALALGGRAMNLAPEVQRAVDLAALIVPFGSANLLAQAVLQGLERLKFVAIASFIGRLVMLAVLVLLLLGGAGVSAAFAGRLAFHLLTLAILVVVILRRGRSTGATAEWRLAPGRLAGRARAALPFGAQRLLAEASMRGTVLVLPFFVTMHSVGLFDAADRIRQTIATMIPIVMIAILPAFSRTFRQDRTQGATLAVYSLKFLLIGMLPTAFLLAAAAPSIIHLLYGAGYEASAPVLQIVVWAQVFLAADMVLKQAMIASDNELAMLKRSAASVLVQILLSIVLLAWFGVRGVAVAIVAGSAFLLLLDALFVRRHVVKIDFAGAISKPLLCAAGAGAAAFALHRYSLLVAIAAAALIYLTALFLLRTFSPGELTLMRSMPGQLLKRRS